MTSNMQKNAMKKNTPPQGSGQGNRRPIPNFLRSWTLSNFKSVRNATVDFSALTVLVGPNSAGKSSLLQSILLFAQNAQRNGRVLDMAARGQMFFNGDLVELGSIDETINKTANEEKENLSFGGDFYLGQETFRPRFGGSRRTQGERIVWKVDFTVDKKNPLSGLALVKQSEVFLCSGNERVGEVIATSADGSQIQVTGFPDDPRFSYEHEAMVRDSSDGNHYEYNSEEKYSAVSFASGLPYEGLVQKPKLEILLSSILSEIRDFSRGNDSLAEAILEAKLSAENQGELFPAFANVDEAVQATLNGLESWLLQEFSAEDSDRTIGSSRTMARRIRARQLIQFGIIPWESFPKVLNKKFVTTTELIEFLSVNEEFGDELDSQISKEVKYFTDSFEDQARSRFANLDAAKKNEFEERIRGMQRNRIVGASVFEAVENWNTYLSEKIRYLEPLREEPKAFYSYASGGGINPQIPLGPKGEHLAQALYDATPRVYPLPNKLDNKERIPLIKAVNAWLPELGLEGQVVVQPQGRQGFFLTVGERVLPMLGTGISQVLPVLALCLIARRGDLILLEQPELHLNPSIQQKLAEFLLNMSQAERQIIVETHSEYMVTRLRLLQAKDSKLKSFVKLLFVEKSADLGTQYREVVSNSFGEILEWPKGFFDQASNDVRELVREISNKKIQAKAETNTSDT
jgi:predicted ATPase